MDKAAGDPYQRHRQRLMPFKDQDLQDIQDPHDKEILEDIVVDVLFVVFVRVFFVMANRTT